MAVHRALAKIPLDLGSMAASSIPVTVLRRIVKVRLLMAGGAVVGDVQVRLEARWFRATHRHASTSHLGGLHPLGEATKPVSLKSLTCSWGALLDSGRFVGRSDAVFCHECSLAGSHWRQRTRPHCRG
jgi:hypothetical protein